MNCNFNTSGFWTKYLILFPAISSKIRPFVICIFEKKKHCMINVSLKIWIASKKTVRIRQKNSQGSLFVCPSHLRSVLLCCDKSVLLFFLFASQSLYCWKTCLQGEVRVALKGRTGFYMIFTFLAKKKKKEERVAINPFLVRHRYYILYLNTHMRLKINESIEL